MFIYNVLFSIFFLQAPLDDIFAHAAIKVKCPFFFFFFHLPLDMWHFPRSRWDPILRLLYRMRNSFNKVGDGLYIKAERSGRHWLL